MSGPTAPLEAGDAAEERPVAGASLAVVVLDADGALVSATPDALRLLGDGLDADGWTALAVDGSPLPADEHPVQRALAEGAVLDGIRLGVRRADGAVVAVDVSTSPVALRDDPRGGVALVLARAATAAVEGDAASAARAAYYRALAGSIPGGLVAVFDTELRYVLVDGPALDARQHALPPMEGRLATEAALIAPEAIEETAPLFRAALAGRTSSLRRARPDGRVYDVTVGPVRDGGRIVGGMALVHDVTEQARLEEEHEALRAVAEAAARGVDVDALVDLVVSRLEGLAGIAAARVERVEDDAPSPPPAPGEVRAPVVVGGRAWGALVGVPDPAGDVAEHAARLAPFAELLAVAVARGEAAAALAASESAHRDVVEASADMLLRVASDGTITYASPSSEHLLGRPPADLAGRPIAELLHPDDVAAGAVQREAIEHGAASLSAVEGRMLRADGSWVWVETTGRAVVDDDGRLVAWQTATRSIQRRKEAEAAAEARTAQYRALARSLPDGAVVLFDHDLTYTLAEGPALRLLPAGAFAGHRLGEVIADADAALGEELFRAALRGETRRARATYLGGRVFDHTVAPVIEDGEVRGGLVLALEVTEQARLEEEHEALREIADRAAHGVEPDELLPFVVERVGRLFGAISAAIHRFDEDGRQRVVAVHPTDLPDMRVGDVVDLGPDTAVGRTVATGLPSLVTGYGERPDEVIADLMRRGAVGGAAAPITIDGRTWGAIGIGLPARADLSEETASRLARFADLLAATIGKAEAEAAVREREARYRAVVEQSVDVILSIDRDDVITFASPAIASVLGWSPADVTGTLASSLFHQDDPARHREVRERVAAAGGEPVVIEGRMRRADGGLEWVEEASRAVVDVTGRVVGRQATCRSIQARKAAEQELRELGARYIALARSLPDGVVLLFDRDLRCLVAEGPLLAHLPPFAGRTAREVMEPFDAEVGIPTLEAALAGVTSRLRRVRVSAGGFMDVVVAPVREDDEVVAAMLLALDATEEARRVAEQEAVREVADAAARGAEPGEVIGIALARVAELFGAVAAAAVRIDASGIAEVVASEPPGDGLDGVRLSPGTLPEPVLAGGPPVVVASLATLADPIAEVHRARGAGSGVAATLVADGRPWGALLIACPGDGATAPEVGERLARICGPVATAINSAEALAVLRRLATTDPLTGLATHRVFDERLAEAVAQAEPGADGPVLLIADVDRFKTVNDVYGHRCGDRVLAAVAAALAAEAGPDDLIARIGGDEFAWIAAAGPGQAAAAAERARAAVAAVAVPDAPRITISIGLASLRGARDPEELIRQADVALYRAKAAGRDRVVAGAPRDERAAHLPPRPAGTEARAGVHALAHAAAARDVAGAGHAERVAALAEALALALGWTTARARLLHEAALLHDLGMLAIPDDVLQRPGPLDADERASVERHAPLGAELAAGVLDPEQVAWIRGHHERWDGAGYPDRLRGAEIPPGARILAVAEAYDAMTSPRPHRRAQPVADVLAECRREAGAQFAPEVVAALEALRRG